MSEKHRIESEPQTGMLDSVTSVKDSEGTLTVLWLSFPDTKRKRKLVMEPSKAAELLAKIPMGSQVEVVDVVEVRSKPPIGEPA